MTNERGMQLHESLALLTDLGLAKWFSRDMEQSTRVVVNALAEHFLEDKCPLDYRPFIESDFIYEYFVAYDWELDWFDLLSGSLAETIEVEANSIALQTNDHDPLTSVSDAEKMIVNFGYEWKFRAKEALKKAIG